MTIPEILRLAPNLEVAQLNATSYAITARGFNVGNNAAMSTSSWCSSTAAPSTRRFSPASTGTLLAFSRRQPLEPKPLDVNRLIGGMSDLVHRAIGEGIEVQTVFGA
ncbi:MAG: hypothetical protein WB697_23960, partial [Stellaceae bacterium]